MLVIDTEGSFRPERLPAIAERFGVDVDMALENIKVMQMVNHDHFDQVKADNTALTVEIRKCTSQAQHHSLIISGFGAGIKNDRRRRLQTADR